mmetsp:Transcript_30405/g.70104  ORF Transcript_30405/g.70104 Transcript_30405/m.70104 type:complete len:221 (+) Transcript_30405:130-792(+)
MLSVPSPAVLAGSSEQQCSKTSSATTFRSMPFSSRGRTKSQMSWLDMTSQIPSQAKTMNSSSGVRSRTMTSGVEQITCSFGGKSDRFLYSRSPMARLRFKFPFTRAPPLPSSFTVPPAASMRALSVSAVGLWSYDNSRALPARHITALLSPAFAVITSSFRTRTHTAVQPTVSATKSSPFSACFSFCSFKKDSCISCCSPALKPPFWERWCMPARRFSRS